MGRRRSTIGVNTTSYGQSTHPRNAKGNYKARKGSKGKKDKYSQKKKAYMDVKAAISALTHLDIDSDDDSNISPSESEYDSNTSSSTFDGQTYSSEEEDSDAS